MKPEDTDNKNLNPSQTKYEDDFGTPQQDTAQSDEFKYTPDQQRNELASNEKSGSTRSSSDAKEAVKKELSNASKKTGSSDKSSNGGGFKTKLASKLSGGRLSKTKKRIMIGVFGSFGAGTLVIIAIIFFMFASGFGVKQAAIVAKNYGFYRLNRIAKIATSRIIEGDVKVKAGSGLKAVAPSSAADKLRGFDIERVMKNLELDGTIKYSKSSSGKVTGVIIGDGEEILLDGRTVNPLRRADMLNKLSAGLDKYVPELSDNLPLISKTSDGIFQRTGLKRIRWSEKVLASHRKPAISPDEALGVDQEAELKAVRKDPDMPKTGDAQIDAARDVADEQMPERSAAGELEPHQKIVDPQIEAIDGSSRILSRSAIGELAEGATTVAVYTACTINAVVMSARQSVDQNNDSSVRMAGKLQSASDQIADGNTTAMSVGTSRKMLGENFADQASYQRATFTSNWQDYEQLPETDFPQPRLDKGWLGWFSKISGVSNTAWDQIKTTQAVATFGLTYLIGLTGHGPSAWSFTEFCGAINTIGGGVVFGLLTGVIENLIAGAFTGGASQAATQPAKLGSKKLIGQAIETISQKAVLSSLKKFAANKVTNYSEKRLGEGILRAVIKKVAVRGGKIGAEAGATAGLAYLIIKTANNSNGHVYSGVSDDQFVNKAIAGTNVMEEDFNRARFQGVPLNEDQQRAALAEQYNTYLANQKKKSFFARLIDLKDPYSAASRIAVRAPTNPDSAKQIALSSLNPLALVDPSQNAFLQFAKTATIDHQKAYASTLTDVELANEGVQQWGYTEEEIALMKTEAYSLTAISEWAATPAAEEEIDRLDLKYGFCYYTKYEMSDILLSDGTANTKPIQDRDGNNIDNAKDRCLNQLASENSTNRNVFKWRLFNMDVIGTDEMIDLQTVTEDSATTTGSTDPGSSVNSGEISADSSATPCAAGTEDLGIREDAYSKGSRIKIRLCAINSIPGGSEESNGGVPNAKGRALVSSIASGGWQKLGEAAKAAGIPLSAGSSWRTMAHQESLCRKDDKCPGGNYNDVAKPGTSNHQAGTAIDISEIYAATGSPASGRTCSNPQTANNATYRWVAANARNFGIKNYANEAWHWGPSESC